MLTNTIIHIYITVYSLYVWSKVERSYLSYVQPVIPYFTIAIIVPYLHYILPNVTAAHVHSVHVLAYSFTLFELLILLNSGRLKLSKGQGQEN